jgi:phytoene dehydrogenase-like protein
VTLTAATQSDCVVVGASFAGLACATALARAGMRVIVLERKADVGEKLHTTGILVKDAIDQIALLDGLPATIVRRIDGVRLYAPSLRPVDLSAPGYYFLVTDTPRLMRWLAAQAVRSSRTRRRSSARSARRVASHSVMAGRRDSSSGPTDPLRESRKYWDCKYWDSAATPSFCSASSTSMRASSSPSRTAFTASSTGVSLPAT